MVRRVLCCVLLMTCLSQAWAATGMGAMMAAQSTAQSDCGGHVDGGNDLPGCCLDGAAANAGCQSACGASAATAQVPIQPALAHGAAPLEILPAPRAGPRYLPLNPPPIA